MSCITKKECLPQSSVKGLRMNNLVKEIVLASLFLSVTQRAVLAGDTDSSKTAQNTPGQKATVIDANEYF